MAFNPFGDGFDSADHIESVFGEKGALDGARVLYAVLNSYGYEESACVIFERDGKLYETGGSHCSCYGFEGQFSPATEVTRESLRMYNRGSKAKLKYEQSDYPRWDEFIASLEEAV